MKIWKDKYKMFVINQHNYNTGDNDFIITINTALGAGASIDLRTFLPDGQTYNFTVLFGDGGSYSYSGSTPSTDANLNYTYGGGDGIYQLTFVPYNLSNAKVGGFSINNGTEKLKFISIDNWGEVEFDNVLNAFYGCTNLATIQDAEIPVTTSCTTFAGFFRNCQLLQTAYSSLFVRGVNVNSFSTTWMDCIGLTSIQSDVYKQNVNVQNFSNCHRNNISLTTLPENLHYYNNLVINYGFEFYLCRNITLPAVIFNLSSLSIVTNFSSFMQAANTGYSNTGTIQDVWNYGLSATSTNAFLNQIGLTNYASIPDAWKGL